MSLFGGALSCLLPPGAKDVSEVRQIPDNQEVLVHEETDQSIIIELLEYERAVEGEQAISHHFHELAQSNNAVAQQVSSISRLPNEQLALNACQEVFSITGQQQVAKFNEGADASNVVTIHLALFRLPQYTTDILVSFNDPLYISCESSSAGAVTQNAAPWTVEQWQTCVNSLTLVDPSVFVTH